MPVPTIEMEEVSKRYELGTGYVSYGLLSADLERLVRAPLRRLLGRPAPEHHESKQEFLALRDVSLEIEPGEAMGLIGVNGAGKTTLLKLLSRITLPSAGRITVRGRVGTLLEVGTGFHPELTGRENVFLNGAILGMRRREIGERFDEIVEFAGIEQFLDTPVKRYSSGMYVRLAFAVAAHLQPEILLVDEVLAVGDNQFQRKCLGKMDEVARAGRTVVFVSHNLPSVQRLCDRSVWLDGGRVRDDGPTPAVIESYLKHVGLSRGGGEIEVREDAHRIGTGEARLVRAKMTDENGALIESLKLGQRCTFTLTFEVRKPIEDVVVEIGIGSADGTRAVTSLSVDDGHPFFPLEAGTHEITSELDMTLLPGDYWVDVGIHESSVRTYDSVERVLSFSALNVSDGDVPPYPWPSTRGIVRVPSRWSVGAPAPT